jgi:hypothetical protein
MSPAALLLALAASAAAGPRLESALSAETAREFARVEAFLSESPAARRLLAAGARLPRREIQFERLPDPVHYDRAARALHFDAGALRGLTEREAALWLALALARAETAAAIPFVESEQAAWQSALKVAAELGAVEPAGLGRRLVEEAAAGERRRELIERSALPSADPWAPSETALFALPQGVLPRAGTFLHLFETDPNLFYRAVELGTAWPPGTARLREIEDLLALRADALAALRSEPRGAFVELGGRRYPGALVRAAWRLRGAGEAERAREALEAFDTVGADSLKRAIRAWRRATAR